MLKIWFICLPKNDIYICGCPKKNFEKYIFGFHHTLRGRLVIQFKHTRSVFKHWTYVSKKRKTCLFIHFQHRLFGKHCSKTSFQTHSFEITFSLFLNNKTSVLNGNWVIILKMVRTHLDRYVSSLPLTIIPKSLHAESQSPPGQLFFKIKHKYQTHISVFWTLKYVI